MKAIYILSLLLLLLSVSCAKNEEINYQIKNNTCEFFQNLGEYILSQCLIENSYCNIYLKFDLSSNIIDCNPTTFPQIKLPPLN